MANFSFLLDEHIPYAVARGLARIFPEIRVYAVGHDDAPENGTHDPDLLRWIEQTGCLLITSDRRTMPGHFLDHLSSGGHVPGIIIVPPRCPIGEIIDLIKLVVGAASPDEFQDQIVYLRDFS